MWATNTFVCENCDISQPWLIYLFLRCNIHILATSFTIRLKGISFYLLIKRFFFYLWLKMHLIWFCSPVCLFLSCLEFLIEVLHKIHLGICLFYIFWKRIHLGFYRKCQKMRQQRLTSLCSAVPLAKLLHPKTMYFCLILILLLEGQKNVCRS